MTPRRPRTRRPWQAPVIEPLRTPHGAPSDPEHIDTVRVLCTLGFKVGLPAVMKMAVASEPFDNLVADDLRHFALWLAVAEARFNRRMGIA